MLNITKAFFPTEKIMLQLYLPSSFTKSLNVTMLFVKKEISKQNITFVAQVSSYICKRFKDLRDFKDTDRNAANYH